MRNSVYVALVHYPVYNKEGKIIATSVTNLDIHDISRSARTYNLQKYYIVTPIDSQQLLTNKVIGFWKEGSGVVYNKDRNEALSHTKVVESIEKAIEDIKEKTNKKVNIITTSAKQYENSISYKKMSEIIHNTDENYLILLGTGWGLIEDIMLKSDYILKPIRENSDYNHLSVRSAASIIFDRLFSDF